MVTVPHKMVGSGECRIVEVSDYRDSTLLSFVGSVGLLTQFSIHVLVVA